MLNKFSYSVKARDKRSNARAGVINTPHGRILTPAFSPVATKASVRSLSSEDLINTNSQVVLANTYHLYLMPGSDTLSIYGGFTNFMNWKGCSITDSGGYQVSFLWKKSKKENLDDFSVGVDINDNGARFRSHIDGSYHNLTPEKSMDIQSVLGADIIMAFDQPIGANYSKKKITEAFNRSILWGERSFKRWKANKCLSKYGEYQALYGIVQGGIDRKLRRESLEFILNMGFPGIAMGGESIGSDPSQTFKTLETVSDLLDKSLPLHALGLGGGPEGIFRAIEGGVDTFDNTGITRMARCGILFVDGRSGGTRKNKYRIDITKQKYSSFKKPVSASCTCYTCKNYSAGYLRHLLVSGETLGLRLASIHNIHFINNLMIDIRKSILDGDYREFVKDYLNS